MKTKHLLSGVTVIAALALSASAWAQPANPSGGNPMGTPGPSPGGPGLTPYSTGAPPPSSLSSPHGTVQAPAPSGRMPAGGRATSGERIPPIMPSASDATSATPPKHHHHAGHATHAAAHHRMAPLTGSTANQLNQQELARLQTGSSMAPPAPMGAMPRSAPMPSPSMQPPTQGGNSMGMPGPNTGGPGLTPYSAGAPPR
jgi:hypothetical protein